MREIIHKKRLGFLEVSIPNFGYYELTCSPSLSQAIGGCMGVNFYFRAKQGEWEFATEDDQGNTLAAGDPHHFLLRGTFNEYEHDAMGTDACARIMRQCLGTFRQSIRRARPTLTVGDIFNKLRRVVAASARRWRHTRFVLHRR